MQPHLLITGANRGIGLALVKLYLDDNWAVTACCREPKKLIALLDVYPSLTICTLDVTDYAAVNKVANKLAGKNIDLLLNNAGYYGPKGTDLGDTNVDEWRHVLEVNAIAPLKIIEAFLPNLAQSQNAVYAAISSKMGSMSDNNSGGSYLYRSSKAALNSVIKSLSIDLIPYKINVIALHPGWVRTEMGGPNGLIDVQESASGMKQVLDQLTPSQNGSFLDFQGKEIAW